MNWAECNGARIIEIRPLRIELWCFERLYGVNSVDFAINWGARAPFRTPALRAQVHEIEPVQRSKHHSSMRNGRIWIILASLDSTQLIVQLTSWKLSSIYGGCQLGSRCSNCMSFEVRCSICHYFRLGNFENSRIFSLGRRSEEPRRRLWMVRTRNNLKCYLSVCVVFLYRLCMCISSRIW